jgi:apolipoprotein N-acyltransferase
MKTLSRETPALKKSGAIVVNAPRVPLFLLVLTSSVLLSLALRPQGFGTLALIALIPGMIAISRETRLLKAALYSYLCSVGAVVVALEGLLREFPFVFMTGVLVYSSIFAFVGAGVFVLKKTWGTKAILAFPIFWVALEFLVSQPAILRQWANPIMAIGYTQFDTPLLQTARWSGVTGTSFLVVAMNAVLVFAFLEQRITRFIPSVALVVLILAALFIPTPTSQPVGKPFRVGIAQAYLPTLEYTIADFDISAQKLIVDRYKALLAKFGQEKVNLVVLPETALGGWFTNLDQNPQILDALQGVSLALIGVKTSMRSENDLLESRNAILEFQREAKRIREVYAKKIPIPMTEAGFTPGKNVGLVRLGGIIFGLGICWENTFPGLARAEVRNGAQVLVYQNSLLWAGATATPVLHQRISAFRAVENARDVIHATAGGSSALINSSGQLIAVAPQVTETVLTGLVQARTGLTVFGRFGDWFGLFSVFIAGFVLTLNGFISRKVTPKK